MKKQNTLFSKPFMALLASPTKLALALAFVAVAMAFSACGGKDSGSNSTPGGNVSLEGVWQIGSGGGLVVSITGNSGVITQISGASGVWQDAINKGYVGVGSQYFRNLAKTGDLTWTGQVLMVEYITTQGIPLQHRKRHGHGGRGHEGK